jgi:carotenoid cleavage dioxygenase-like enzyme
MFTFGYSHDPPYVTYRVINKDGVMLDPVPITIPAPVMMHDFAITENYAIFMDLPLYFRPKVRRNLEHLKVLDISNYGMKKPFTFCHLLLMPDIIL